MGCHRIETNDLPGHDLDEPVHLFVERRRAPSGPEILLAQGFIEKMQGFPVHMEDLFQQGTGYQMAHVGHVVEIEQGISVAEVAQIYPIVLAPGGNDVAGVEIPVQAGGDGFQLVDIAQQPCFDIVRKLCAVGNEVPRPHRYAVKGPGIAGNRVQGLGARYVQRIEGDFFAVMGLPAADLWRFLNTFDL